MCCAVGAGACEWLLLLSLLAGASCVIARSPSPSLPTCKCLSAKSRHSLQSKDHAVDQVDALIDTTHASLFSNAHKVTLILFLVLLFHLQDLMSVYA